MHENSVESDGNTSGGDSSSNENEDFLSDEDFDDIFENFCNRRETETSNASKPSLIVWICFFLSVWQYTYGITDTALASLIKFLDIFFSLACTYIPSK